MPPKKSASKAKKGSDIFEDKVFALSGTLSQSRDEITSLLEENGGSVASSVTKKVTHLVTTAEDFAGGSNKVETAKKNGIFIVNEDYIHDSIKAGEAKKEDPYLLASSKKRKADDDEEKPAKKEKKEDAEEEEEEEEKPKKGKGKGKKAAAAKKKKVEKEEEEEEEEEKKPVRKSARATKGKAKAAEDDEEEEEEEKEEEKPKPKDDEEAGEKKKIVVKGKAAVDSYCGKASNFHVLEEGGVIYDCMLNQTNIGNNNNKFYVIQVLEKDGGGEYYHWNRWGRVGEKGQNKLEPCGSDKSRAIAQFEKKFYEKTKNRWDNRGSFKTVSGKYTLIEIDYGADIEPQPAEKEEKKAAKPVQKTSSKLDTRVQDLIKLIFDLKMMESVMTEMEYDIKKMPLGKLTKQQIKSGYEVLKEIDEAIQKGKGTSVLEGLSNRFYTLIPHALGRSKLPIIKNAEVVKNKMDMLAALADIEIATKLMKNTDESSSSESPIDANYAQLKCDIEPLDTDSEEYKQIATYVKNTHQNTTPKIKCVYRINREGEKPRFESKANLGNRKLLWHGSRLTNYVGIISQGLRIAPPEAPVSGYRFGKGIYFADIMSLSSIYCRTGGSNDFCMLLGDVALGKEAEVERDTYMEKPLAGTHSTKALGTIEPSPKEAIETKDGYIIPSGKIVESGKKNVSCREHQYIVYDVSQVHLKYLLHLNWN